MQKKGRNEGSDDEILVEGTLDPTDDGRKLLEDSYVLMAGMEFPEITIEPISSPKLAKEGMSREDINKLEKIRKQKRDAALKKLEAEGKSPFQRGTGSMARSPGEVQKVSNTEGGETDGPDGSHALQGERAVPVNERSMDGREIPQGNIISPNLEKSRKFSNTSTSAPTKGKWMQMVKEDLSLTRRSSISGEIPETVTYVKKGVNGVGGLLKKMPPRSLFLVVDSPALISPARLTPNRIGETEREPRGCSSQDESWMDCKSEVTATGRKINVGVTTLDDPESSSSDKKEIGATSSPLPKTTAKEPSPGITEKLPYGMRRMSEFLIKGTGQKEPGSQSDTMEDVSAASTFKRKRVVTPPETANCTGSATGKRCVQIAKRGAVDSLQSEDTVLIRREELEMIRGISQAAMALEELRSKCRKGLKGDIRGAMRDHIEGIGMNADTLLAKYGNPMLAKQADIRATAVTNKKILALEKENRTLQTQMGNLKREIEALRVRKSEVFHAPGLNKELAHKTYAQAATIPSDTDTSNVAEELPARVEGKRSRLPQVVRNEKMVGKVTIKPAKEGMGSGISEEQLQCIIETVAGALGVAIRGPAPPTVDRLKPESLSQGIIRREFLKTIPSDVEKVNTRTTKEDPSETRSTGTSSMQEEGSSGKWAQPKRKKRAGSKAIRAQGKVQQPKREENKSKASQSNRDKIKLPRTVAVMLSRNEGGSTTYASALEIAMREIDLRTLGIQNTKMRNARNGRLIIEIPRADGGSEKAEKLRQEMRKVIPGDVNITCPSRKIGMRMTGFHEAVSPDEIRRKLAETTKSDPARFTVGKISTLRGVAGVIVHAPADLAAAIIGSRSLTIGWTEVKVTLLQPRITQCLRCLQYGHSRNSCTSSVDRSKICFNCGGEGHLSGQCREESSCPLCDKTVAPHRMGTRDCRSYVEARKLEQERDELKPKTNNG